MTHTPTTADLGEAVGVRSSDAGEESPAAGALVVHAIWADGSLRLWGETCGAVTEERGEEPGDAPPAHPFAAPPGELARMLGGRIGLPPGGVTPGETVVRFPTAGGRPMRSPRSRHLAHDMPAEDQESAGDDDTLAPALAAWRVPTLAVSAEWATPALERLEEEHAETEDHLLGEASGHEALRRSHLAAGDDVRFFATAGRLARSLVAGQRFVPTLLQARDGGLRGAWEPWLADEAIAARASALLRGMPASARAAVDALEHDAAAVLLEFLSSIVDASCRRTLRSESMIEAVEDWEGADDPHVAWLSALLDRRDDVPAADDRRTDMVRQVRRWIGGLEDRADAGGWRLALRLNEPLLGGQLANFAPPGEDVEWTLSFHLQCVTHDGLMVDAEDLWSLRGDAASIDGVRLESPQDLLLAELGRASRVYRRLESALEEASPTKLELNTTQAYEFLREIGPILAEQGFGVIPPAWWDSPAARLGARLQLTAPPGDDATPGGGSAGDAASATLGLDSLVSYQWRLAVGDTPLSLDEFQELAKQRAPLVQVEGRWVEVRREDIEHALAFLRENPGGEMRVGEALRMAFAYDVRATGLPIVGVDAAGWVADLLGGSDGAFSMVEPPARFVGELRPYQLKGLSWLAFLDRVGLGPCLADDMGLGKTIQLLALLVHERERAGAPLDGERSAQNSGVAPTLVVVPMSVVGNWMREAARFAPGLRVMVHHGVERLSGDAFVEVVSDQDVVITTYALAHRDRDLLERVRWGRVVLDEAQNIKNPAAKQSQAVRALDAPRRVALTGTPLENRLSELWSIMDFCNPGFLGSAGEFRRSFSVPIERHRDRRRATQLRAVVRPFVLRRLKTDPTVISDLPEKLETKEYCRLTAEQVQLYESCVKTMLGEVERSEGIRRRGIVLTTLIRLKQVCDHPALMLKGEQAGAPRAAPAANAGQAGAGAGGGGADAPRSGKCIRLLEMLDEVVAADEQALVFTQFRQMGHLLVRMLRQGLDREILFLHGGTSQKQREQMVERFQKADGSTPIFILSLKAGGVGLNLTAASHVFHFDRWWNPAVENQATDRAFRIGQTKTVNVHKFIVSGTLEERIDQMIESKIALAEDVIGSGEEWLTELSTTQLRDMLALRPDALADEG